MSRDSRKKLLLLACATDRLELEMKFVKANNRPFAGIPGLNFGAATRWMEMGAAVVAPLLPVRFRLLMQIGRVAKRFFR